MKETVTLVRRQRAGGALQIASALSGEESQARGLLGLHRGTWKWSIENGCVLVSRTLQMASAVRGLPGMSPQEVVEAALLISAAEERGTQPGPVANPTPLRRQPAQGDAGLVPVEPVDQAPLLLCELPGSGGKGEVLGPVLLRLSRPCWRHFCCF